MNNAFNRLINRLDLSEERLSELEDTLKEISKTERQRKTKAEKKNTCYVGEVGNKNKA